MNNTNMVLREEKIISEVLEFLKALHSTRNKTYVLVKPAKGSIRFPVIEA